MAESSTFRWRPRTRSASGERASLTYGSNRLETNSKALVQAPDKNAHSADGQREKRTVSELADEQAADPWRDQLRGSACHYEQADIAAGGIARPQHLSDDRKIDRGQYAAGRGDVLRDTMALPRTPISFLRAIVSVVKPQCFIAFLSP